MANLSGEFDLIARYFAPLAHGDGAFGLTDDAALLRLPSDHELVVSTDAIVEAVHFLPEESPSILASRLLAVGFSDLAAMAALPLSYTLALALPRSWPSDQVETWLAAFADGLRTAQAALGIGLLGGDTVATPGPLSLSLTVFGAAKPGRVLRRCGASVGDLVCVSGTIGDAALGLAVLQGRLEAVDPTAGAYLTERFRRPTARCGLGQLLSAVAVAAADISDGLVADLSHVCRASGTGATIAGGQIPLSSAARSVLTAAPGWWRTALTGGDDYELVFALPKDRLSVLADCASEAGVPLTVIGNFDRPLGADPGVPVRVIMADGGQLDTGAGGYQHF